MQKKEPRKYDVPKEKLETKPYIPEVEVKDEVKPIMLGIATTNLTVRDGEIKKGEEVKILKDNGDQWLTNKGLVSKLYLLLEKI